MYSGGILRKLNFFSSEAKGLAKRVIGFGFVSWPRRWSRVFFVSISFAANDEAKPFGGVVDGGVSLVSASVGAIPGVSTRSGGSDAVPVSELGGSLVPKSASVIFLTLSTSLSKTPSSPSGEGSVLVDGLVVVVVVGVVEEVFGISGARRLGSMVAILTSGTEASAAKEMGSGSLPISDLRGLTILA